MKAIRDNEDPSGEVFHETAWDFCYDCNGSGMHCTGEEVVPCYHCKGNGTVRARDIRGRFTRVRLPD